MITSMTGFGRGVATEKGFQVTVEMKSLNSRFLDISVRLPSSLNDKELVIKEKVQKMVRRGKINITVNVDKFESDEPEITYQPDLVKFYSEMLRNMNEQAGLSSQIELDHLMIFEDIFVKKPEDPKTVELTWALTNKAADEALDTLVKMRKNEGGQLKKELISHIQAMDSQLEKIVSLAEDRAPEALEKLKERMSALLSDDEIDPARLDQELALLVDKMDIQEEVTRLKSHLKFFLEAIESSDPVGRRLNFLSQEINRELNTIGSKANDSEISHLVVYSKEKLEQVREQVQNIE